MSAHHGWESEELILDLPHVSNGDDAYVAKIYILNLHSPGPWMTYTNTQGMFPSFQTTLYEHIILINTITSCVLKVKEEQNVTIIV